MILIDTNVLSEPIRPHGNPLIARWLNTYPAEQLFLSAVSLGEALAGLAAMPIGRRRQSLELALDSLTNEIFPDRILPYDADTARIYAIVLSKARSRGIAIAGPDAQIAAIAIQHGFAVATRDVMLFRGVGLRVINPWEEA
jgi:predicted nucleic acid-binding protein